MADLLKLSLLFVIAVSTKFSQAELESFKTISNEIPQIASDDHSSRLFESKIDEAVESIKVIIQNGHPGLGIPPLDPLLVDEFSHNFNSEIISGNLNLSNLRATGLADFLATGGYSLISSKLKLDAIFDTLELATAYSGDLNVLGLVHLYGKGNLSLIIDPIDMKTSFTIQRSTKLQIIGLELYVKLPTAKTVITGLFNDEFMSDIISRQLTDTLNTLAQEEEERINKLLHGVLWEVIEKIINPILAGEKYNTVTYQELYESIVPVLQQNLYSLAKQFFSRKVDV